MGPALVYEFDVPGEAGLGLVDLAALGAGDVELGLGDLAAGPLVDEEVLLEGVDVGGAPVAFGALVLLGAPGKKESALSQK